MSLIFTIFTLIGIYSYVDISNYPSYAQRASSVTTKVMPPRINNPTNSSSTNLITVATTVDIIPKIKILSPNNDQKVPVTNNNNLVVYGTSSDDRSKNCKVSVLLNGIKPYQKTIAIGKNGANDFSTWRYKLDPSYTIIREGSNKLTSKITCHTDNHISNKWTSVDLIGTRKHNGGSNSNTNTTTDVIKPPLPLRISTSVDKNPITAGDIQTVTVRVHNPGITNSAISGAKVRGHVIDLSSSSFSSSSSFHSKNMNAVVEHFDGNTDKNGKVSYSWKVPLNTPIGTPYIIKVNALFDKYSGRSESDIFTVEPSNNDNPFILAQASRNFTNGLNSNIKNFTQEIFDKVKNSLENDLK